MNFVLSYSEVKKMVDNRHLLNYVEVFFLKDSSYK